MLVRACRITAGQRVLDVAAGTGNVAIRAAATGAEVVASDLVPEHFAAGRREAAEQGVELEWREADAEALPFADAEFDVVTSLFGAMFVPDHQRVADELVRVCRPGGTIGLASFTPGGLEEQFFAVFAPYLPARAPGAPAPELWGDEDHVRSLFGDRVVALDWTRAHYVERAPSATAYRDFCRATFGPVAAVYAGLANDPARREELDRAFLEFATAADGGPPGGPAEYRYDYLLVVARRAAP